MCLINKFVLKKILKSLIDVKIKPILLIWVILLNMTFYSLETSANPIEVKGGFIDDFESYITDDIFARSKIWDYRTNTDTTTMCISSDANGNSYLDLNSVSGKDTILITKNNLFNTSSKTVVNFSLKSLKATKETACAKVYINIGKTSYPLIKATWGKLYFPNDTAITSSYDSWNDVKVLVDNIEHTATVTAGGKSHVVEIAEIVDAAVIRVQAVGENTVSIDNFMIADAFYYGDTYVVDEDFENLEFGSVTGQVVNGMKYSGDSCMNISSDAVTENKYIKASPTASVADPVLYTSYKITEERTVLEYDVKMDNPDGQFGVYIRLSNGTKLYLMRYNMGTFTLLLNNKPTNINVCGEDFITFKFCISNTGNTSVFVDGKYVTYYNYNTDISGTDIRFHCNYGTNKPQDLTTSAVSLDNIKIYIPSAPEIRTVIKNGESNVTCSDYIELEMNNPVNTSSFAKTNFLLNGSSELISSCNSAVKPYRIYVNGGLKPDTTYTLSVVNNKVKDFYDQSINDFSLTFTTGKPSFTADEYSYDIYNAYEGTKVIFASYADDILLDVKLLEAKGCMSGSIADVGLDTSLAETMKVYFWDDNVNPLESVFETAVSHDAQESVVYTYPGYVQKAVTFSYDDLIADNDNTLMSIFSEYGVKATFNLITEKFSDSDASLSVEDVRKLYEGFDVISHSYSHPIMTQVTFDEVLYEIKKAQEDLTQLCGYEPIGFVWPYNQPGRTDYNDILQYIKDNTAIKYIRPTNTTGNFKLPENWYVWKPTCHHDELPEILPEFKNAKPGREMLLLSVWGHSYEFERESTEVKLRWNDIENYAKQIGEDSNFWKADNTEIYNYLSAVEKCKADNVNNEYSVVNNTDVDIYAMIDGNQTLIPAHEEVFLKKPVVACWGDSLTYGEGSSSWTKKSYPAVLQSLLPDYDIRNMGVGGETSMTIAARQGAVDIKLDEDIIIPASTDAVDISFSAYNKDGSYAGVVTPRNTSIGGWTPLTIEGMEGKMAITIADTWPRTLASAKFTRDSNGTQKTVTAGTLMYPDSLATAKEADINIIFTGTNGGWNSSNTIPYDRNAADLVELTNKMIQNTKNPENYIVIGLTTGEADAWEQTTEAFKQAYGEKFLDIKSYLASSKALADAEIQPTENDLSAMAVGKIPPSLLASDGTHFNDAGYRLFGIKVYEKMIQLGYAF